ncbi:methyltransferase domain-containing protein [Candidatus Uhrbacteria bacterium]|nr:methyltransferase domain-containing protein [Candidatus Uhrbacteria bacterium]
MPSVVYQGKDLEAMSFAPNYHEWICSFFKPHLGEKVIEVGAGIGNFSKLLLMEEIKELCALEPSALFVDLRKSFAHDARVSCHHHSLGEIAEKYQRHFSAAVYVNVLEHIEDDSAELRTARSALCDNGRLCIFVPALPMLYSDYDRSVGHYRRYTKKELVDKVVTAGFTVFSATYFDFLGIAPWFLLYRVLRKKEMKEKNVKLFDSIVPILKKMEKLIQPPIGKNIILIAEKA